MSVALILCLTKAVVNVKIEKDQVSFYLVIWVSDVAIKGATCMIIL